MYKYAYTIITLAKHYAQSSRQLWVDEHMTPHTTVETRFNDKYYNIQCFIFYEISKSKWILYLFGIEYKLLSKRYKYEYIIYWCYKCEGYYTHEFSVFELNKIKKQTINTTHLNSNH